MSEERSPLFLALDCGELSFEEVPNYQKSAAYLRARAVYTSLVAHAIGKGGFISTKISLHYNHFYIAVYAPEVPLSLQKACFRVMDRYRQEWRQDWRDGLFGDPTIVQPPGFVQFPQELIEKHYEDRGNIAAQGMPTEVSISEQGSVTSLYERHQPRVIPMGEQPPPPPVPIEPPFESMPLYYEKGVVETTPTRKASTKKTFFERHLTTLRTDYEAQEQKAMKGGMEPSLVAQIRGVGQAIIWSVLQAQKYRFTPSAMAMVQALMSEQGTLIKSLPARSVLIEFPERMHIAGDIIDPIAGLSFMRPFQAYQEWVALDPERRKHIHTPENAEELQKYWTLSVLAEDGASLFNALYESDVQRWRVPEIRTCLTGECVQTMSPQEMADRGAWTNYELCPVCAGLLAFFSRWVPVALLMIDGEFAEEQEEPAAVQQRTVEESVTYKEKRAGSGKYDEKKTSAHWRIVSFDASVKRPPVRSSEAREEERQQGPSWVELGIAQGRLFKMDITLGQTERHLDPARNPRWKEKRTVTVRPHPTKVVVTLETLQKRVQKVTKVTASRYE